MLRGKMGFFAQVLSFWSIVTAIKAMQSNPITLRPIHTGTYYAKLGDNFTFLCRDNVTPAAEHIEIRLWEVPDHEEYKNALVLYHTADGIHVPIDESIPQSNRLNVSCRSVREENNAVTECLLILSHLTESDYGKYGCHRVVLKDENGFFEDIGSTVVKELKQAVPAGPPRLTVPKVQEHEPGTFNCSSSGGQPAPHFSWSLNGKDILPGSPSNTTVRVDGKVSTSILTWSSVPRQLSGQLRCIIRGASVTDGQSEVVETVVVRYCAENFVLQPTLASTSSLRVLENGSVTFNSSASGNPKPTFLWQHGSVNVSHTSDLTITNLNQAHSGNYTCRALQSGVVNCLTQTGRLNLDVLYGPKSIKIDGKIEHVIESKSLLLKCSSVCNPDCSFNWTQPLATAASVQGAELRVANVTRDHAGRYTCYPSNTQVPSPGQGQQRTGVGKHYVNVSVAFGPDSMTGVLTSIASVKLVRPSSYRLVATVDFDAGAVSCNSAQCQPASACSYWWDTSVNPLQLGRLSTEGLTIHVCWANNSITKRMEKVAALSVYTHGAASNLTLADVTARTAALNFTLGFTGGLAHSVSAEWKLQTAADWVPVQRVTEQTNSTLRVWLPQPGEQIHVRISTQITGEEQSKVNSDSFMISLEDVPTFSSNPTVQPNGNEATLTFSYTGGRPRWARVCVSKNKNSQNCDALGTKSLTTENRHRRNNVHEVLITGLNGDASDFWYQLSLHDGPELLRQADWIPGGSAKQPSSKSEFPVAAVGGGVGAFLLLLCLVVIILLVFRLRKPKTHKEEKKVNILASQDEAACTDVDLEMAPYSFGYSGVSNGVTTEQSKDALNGIQNGRPSEDDDFTISPYSTGHAVASSDVAKADVVPVYAKVNKKGAATSSFEMVREDVSSATANGDVEKTPAIYTKPKKKVQVPAVYSKVNKKKKKDKAGPSKADSTDDASLNVYEDVGKPNEKKKQKLKKKEEKKDKGKKSKSNRKQGPDGAEYSNLTPEVAYANVEQKKPEQVYSNVNAPKKLTDIIVDSAKEHEDWKENQQGLEYADIQASRPVLPQDQQQPVHAAPDNTTYAAVDFSRGGAANI